MLFGEYAVIHGSPALAIPCKKFYGQFSKGHSSYDLTKFWEYLKNENFAHVSFNEELLNRDLKNQVSFETNIAIGYGLGSSGAFCASVFDRYFDRLKRFEITDLKNTLAHIESFFHGKSSGLDPLVSYLQSGILKHSNEELELVAKSTQKRSFYLVDTGISRSTEQWVKVYLEKYKDKSYQQGIRNLIMLNKKCIEQYINGGENLKDCFTELSNLEFELFHEMIPQSFLETFTKHQLKLCGAGGGGFFLGMSTTDEVPEIEKYPVIKVD